MRAHPSHAPALADLVELAGVLERERDRPRGALHRRDREVGRDLAGLRDRPARQLVAWLRRVREPGDAAAAKVAAAARLVSLALGVLGLVVGWGVAAVLFYYDGTTPVNVINVLAVFVGVQLVLLLPLAVMLLPRVPGLVGLQESLALVSPGSLWRLVLPMLPEGPRGRLTELLGQGQAHGRVYGVVHKWAVLRWAQLFAMAFNVGAIARFLQLIVFSDVAFAWSTTLEVETATVHAILAAMATPWAWAWRDAAPTLQLVADTRFFRPQTIETPEAFGGWWPFVLMCMLVYGLLPRVVALGIAAWRLRRSVAWAMVHLPGAADVLDRLNNEYVETRAAEPERAAASDQDETPAPSAALPRRVRAVVNWSGVPLDDAALRGVLQADGVPVLHCGGARSLEEDAQAIAAIPKGEGGAVVVATKSWEPPMLEVVDFLSDVRRAVGEGVPITLTPMALGDAGRLVEPNATHLAQWQRKAKAAGDPWLSVAVPIAEGGAA